MQKPLSIPQTCVTTLTPRVYSRFSLNSTPSPHSRLHHRHQHFSSAHHFHNLQHPKTSNSHRPPPCMAEQQQQQRPMEAMKGFPPKKGPSTAQVLAIVTLLPVGGVLMGLAGLTLIGTLIGLAITTPLFVICSPILVPAVIAIGLAVTGFLTSGAFGITALSSLSWMLNYVRRTRGSLPEQIDYAKRRVQDTAGQRIRDVGQRTQEAARS